MVQNSFPIATMLNKINVKKKSISALECSTFYTTTLDRLLIKVLSEVMSFVVKSKVRQHITFSKTSIYWTSQGVGRRYFTKHTHVHAIYWLSKIHKTLVGARFIVASYYCSTNSLSDTISKYLKMVFNTVESFHKKRFLLFRL